MKENERKKIIWIEICRFICYTHIGCVKISLIVKENGKMHESGKG